MSFREYLAAQQQLIDLELERLVRRCLEKRPADRFQTARDLCSALESPVPPTTPASPHRRRMPLMRSVLAVALVAALVGTTYYLAGTGRKPIDSIAVLPFGATEPHNLHMPYGTDNFQVQEMGREKAYETRYREWRASSPHARLFRRAAEQPQAVVLRRPGASGTGPP